MRAHGGHVGIIAAAYTVLTVASLVHAVTFYHLVGRHVRAQIEPPKPTTPNQPDARITDAECAVAADSVV